MTEPLFIAAVAALAAYVTLAHAYFWYTHRRWRREARALIEEMRETEQRAVRDTVRALRDLPTKELVRRYVAAGWTVERQDGGGVSFARPVEPGILETDWLGRVRIANPPLDRKHPKGEAAENE